MTLIFCSVARLDAVEKGRAAEAVPRSVWGAFCQHYIGIGMIDYPVYPHIIFILLCTSQTSRRSQILTCRCDCA